MFLVVGTIVSLLGGYITIDRVVFLNRSFVTHARVLRQTSTQVEVLPRNINRTIWIQRAASSRRGKLSYRVGRMVEIRADTTASPTEAYMNSFYSLWFFPIGAIGAGLFFLLLGFATPRPWQLESINSSSSET